MEHIVLIDVETDGVDPQSSHVIEVAACRYSVVHATPLWFFSTLVRAESNAAEAVNGIPPKALATAQTFEAACRPLAGVISNSDAVAGWNAPEFDRLFFPKELQDAKPWIDLMDDVTWPRQSTSRSLVAAALAMGCGVADAHRALSDVTLMARMLTRAAEMGVRLEEMLAHGLRPKGLFEVTDKSFSKERNALAKQQGFRWDEVSKTWRRKMALMDAMYLPFAVTRVDETAP